MIIAKDGKECTCGKRGCFECYGSMKALKEKIKQEYEISEEIHSRELMQILEENTEKSNKILNEYLDYLTIGISNLVDLFEPEIVSIGGSFAYYKELFLDKFINKMYTENVTFNNRKDLKIVLATEQNDAGILGAVIEV